MTIGVLADTHIPFRARRLPEPVFEAFRGVDLILHAGDLNVLAVLGELRGIAEVRAVVGNTDPWDVAQALPRTVCLEVDGVRIGLAHGHEGKGRSTPERAASWFPEAQVVVFGHSHRPLVTTVGERLLVNPGSPTDRRGAPAYSCALIRVANGQATAQLVEW